MVMQDLQEIEKLEDDLRIATAVARDATDGEALQRQRIAKGVVLLRKAMENNGINPDSNLWIQVDEAINVLLGNLTQEGERWD